MGTFVITTLVENCVYNRNLQAEHGLSLYIRTPEFRILFDTGQSGLLLRNAELLHIDLREIDFLVLSHGHSDHTGGLQAFLEVNQKATVICKEGIRNRKFKKSRENGLMDSKELDWTRFRFLAEIEEICPGVILSPHIPISNHDDTHFDSFYTEVDGVRIPDTFEDELVLYLATKHTFSVISACSHRGITHMIEQGKQLFPDKRLHTVAGGFHIHSAGEEKLDIITDYFQNNLPRYIGVCHCTGVDQFPKIVERLPQCMVFYNYVGNQFTIED